MHAFSFDILHVLKFIQQNILGENILSKYFFKWSMRSMAGKELIGQS